MVLVLLCMGAVVVVATALGVLLYMEAVEVPAVFPQSLEFFLGVVVVVGTASTVATVQRVKSAYMFSRPKVNDRDLLLSFDHNAQCAEFHRKFANYWSW